MSEVEKKSKKAKEAKETKDTNSSSTKALIAELESVRESAQRKDLAMASLLDELRIAQTGASKAAAERDEKYALAAQLVAANDAAQKAKKQQDQAQKDTVAAQKELAALRQITIDLEAKLEVANATAAALAEKLETAKKDKDTIRQLRLDLQKRAEQDAQRDMGITKLSQELDRTKAVMATELDKAMNEKQHLSSIINEAAADRDALLAEFEKLKAELKHSEEESAKRKKKLKKKEKEVDEVKEDKKAAKEEVKSLKVKLAKNKVEKEVLSGLEQELAELRAAKEQTDMQLQVVQAALEKTKASAQKKDVKIKHIEVKNKIQIDDKLRELKLKVVSSIDETIQSLLGVPGGEQLAPSSTPLSPPSTPRNGSVRESPATTPSTGIIPSATVKSPGPMSPVAESSTPTPLSPGLTDAAYPQPTHFA
ncbi:hypothetical protein BCR33DRAFT_721977 [Rhizoclosmatium globosum]|uniref:Uncharacterized protein n=1 Tax=Rhizoclosmatium globosum TaxID=329046 RepID=A0A1Y2BNX1_9FUNG|nr:hypothetical protein BCR33DRAFT_721977 [Rhizoclosmatium globosum]|eukprot:ORY36450.1 hypothetical protein BCR33DRAFT_721977 [Rhizoclosmatium globosum]